MQSFIKEIIPSKMFKAIGRKFSNFFKFPQNSSVFIEDFIPNNIVISNHSFETKWLYQIIFLNKILIY